MYIRHLFIPRHTLRHFRRIVCRNVDFTSFSNRVTCSLSRARQWTRRYSVRLGSARHVRCTVVHGSCTADS